MSDQGRQDRLDLLYGRLQRLRGEYDGLKHCFALPEWYPTINSDMGWFFKSWQQHTADLEHIVEEAREVVEELGIMGKASG